MADKKQKKAPNILFLLTDDQRYGTIGALGNPEIQTPNMDRLVRNGTAFLQAHIPGGTAYAVWTGIGAVGTALLGIVLFGESASPARLLCIGLILAGIAGLKLLSDA